MSDGETLGSVGASGAICNGHSACRASGAAASNIVVARSMLAVTLLNGAALPHPNLKAESHAAAINAMLVTGVTPAATVGYVILDLRKLYRLASLVSALPVWKQFDLPTVLENGDPDAGMQHRKRDGRAADKDEERTRSRFG